ncbi:MAG: low-specificity L-threonine aldolase [Neomegalonema sp.]|nr:low-specificity L-threonine aldolase [Neomegalonema sp.]
MYDLESRTHAIVADLRSDTVTKPCDSMRAAMAAAEVGDDVYGEDPTVARLEALAAEMLGKEAAIFAPSGTQTNLLGVLSHCGRGEEALIGRRNHIFRYEGLGSAVLGGVAVAPLEQAANGAISRETIAAAVKPDDPHFPISRLLCLENSFYGRVQSLAEIDAAVTAARAAGLRAHLDGARFFNAATALGVEPAALAAPFDSISICLSKGLGAPVGSVLVGDRETIAKARRYRKMLGGGMRQVGVIAAAGLFALENLVERLEEDHARAKRIAQRLAAIEGLAVDLSAVETNMIFPQIADADCAPLRDYAAAQGVALSLHPGESRLVVHRDVDDAGEQAVVAAFEEFYATPNEEVRRD